MYEAPVSLRTTISVPRLVSVPLSRLKVALIGAPAAPALTPSVTPRLLTAFVLIVPPSRL